MNSLLYDRKTAFISVTLMVLVSIFILGGNSLRAERQRVVDVFRGQNELGIDTQQEAILILSNAANLRVIADRYLSSNAAAERITSITDNTAVPLNHILYWDHVNFEAQFVAADRVIPFVYELLDALRGVDVSHGSAAHLTEIDGNIRGAVRRINLSGAMTEGAGFNALLRNPYTGLIATVRGVADMPVAVNLFD